MKIYNIKTANNARQISVVSYEHNSKLQPLQGIILANSTFIRLCMLLWKSVPITRLALTMLASFFKYLCNLLIRLSFSSLAK